MFEITPDARNYTPIYSKMYFFLFKTFLHIQYFSKSKSSPHLKFLHMTKNSPRTMFAASTTNIKYAPGPRDNAIEHAMFGMISRCRIALSSIRCHIVLVPNCPVSNCPVLNCPGAKLFCNPLSLKTTIFYLTVLYLSYNLVLYEVLLSYFI